MTEYIKPSADILKMPRKKGALPRKSDEIESLHQNCLSLANQMDACKHLTPIENHLGQEADSLRRLADFLVSNPSVK